MTTWVIALLVCARSGDRKLVVCDFSENVNGSSRSAKLAGVCVVFSTLFGWNTGVTIGAGANYVSKVYANVNNTKWVPSYWRYDAMASYVVNKHTTLQLNIQNLTDEVYYNAVSSPHYANIAPGRSATLTANFTY